MNKKLLTAITVTLLCTSMSAYAYKVTTISPLLPTNGFGNNYQDYQNDSYPKITQIEGILFNKSFANEDIYNRLNRIETKMFRQTNANMDLAQRVDIIAQSINPSEMYNIPLDNLAKIEYKLFNRSYINDDVETRVIRLEKEMLGAMQQGELDERYQVVASAAKHYNAFPPDNYNGDQTYQRIQQPYIASNTTGGKGILHNVLSALAGGAMTGFTPPLTDPYGNYCSSPYMSTPYNQNNWMQNLFPEGGAGFVDYNRTNRGYSNNTRNLGSRSSVHVLYD